MWIKREPGTPARGGSGAPRRGPCRGKVDPRRLPPTSGPRPATALLGGALAGSGPGTSPCIDGLSWHRRGRTPAPCLFKPFEATMVALVYAGRLQGVKARSLKRR